MNFLRTLINSREARDKLIDQLALMLLGGCAAIVLVWLWLTLAW